MLRTEAGRDPYDKALTDLVGELCTRSDAFRVRWAAHDVRLHRTGLKHFHHPVVGDLHLSYEVMELPADPGLALIAFSAEAGSPDDDALKLLASWAATHDPADARGDTQPAVSQRADLWARFRRNSAGGPLEVVHDQRPPTPFHAQNRQFQPPPTTANDTWGVRALLRRVIASLCALSVRLRRS